MATPEGKVKDKIKKVLKAHKAYYLMVVQNGMGANSIDFLGCHHGRFFGIEAKAGAKQATECQAKVMKDMADAGGTTFLVNEFEGLDVLEDWLDANGA